MREESQDIALFALPAARDIASLVFASRLIQLHFVPSPLGHIVTCARIVHFRLLLVLLSIVLRFDTT